MYYTCMKRFETLCTLKELSTFRRNILLLSSEYSSKPYLAYYSSLKMNAVRTSETSVNFHQTTRRHITDDNTLHDYYCENLDLGMFSESRSRAYKIHSFFHIYRVILILCYYFTYLYLRCLRLNNTHTREAF
jgi:hypothetical protein